MTKIFNRCTGQTYLVSNSYVPKTDCEVIILDEVDVMPKEKKYNSIILLNKIERIFGRNYFMIQLCIMR